MGLDGVELVMEVEGRFRVSIPDEEAGEIRTVGDLYRYLLAKLPGSPEPRCQSAMAFYRLRRGLIDVCAAGRDAVRPSTPLDELIPLSGRRGAWAALGDSLGWRLPRLHRPAWLVRSLEVLFYVLTLGWLAVCLEVVPRVPLPAADPAGSFVGFLIVEVAAALLFAIVASFLTAPFATCVPEDSRTVRGLVGATIRLNPAAIGALDGRYHQSEVWRSLCELVSEQLGVDPERLTEQTRFVEDLGMD